jgi:hypothetical protein
MSTWQDLSKEAQKSGKLGKIVAALCEVQAGQAGGATEVTLPGPAAKPKAKRPAKKSKKKKLFG